jgi:UDP-N-acetylmuramoylalanine--D-glutamate ligase
MNVAILGYSVEGKSAAEYWHNLGHSITVCDLNTAVEVPEWAQTRLGEQYLDNLDQFDLIVRSPGLAPKKITAANPEAPDILQKVTSTINEFCANCPAPIIGITGTKGKGTTSTLISKILEASGKKVFLGGNIGIPVLDFLPQVSATDYVVLELSSFQLIDFKHKPTVGVCVMVVPEHLDWHTDLAEYYGAKKNLFKNQTAQDKTIFNCNYPATVEIINVSQGQKVPYCVEADAAQEPHEKNGAYVHGDAIFYKENEVCKVSDVGLLGRHNLENVCAAIAATWEIVGGDVAAMHKAISEFTGMEHRIEFVKEIGGVKYYNDSFATTPEATIAAIKAFDQPKVVILGGSDKGVEFNELAAVVASNNVKLAVIIGQTGEKIIEALVKVGFDKITLGGTTMRQAITVAKSAAQPGDVVLLSTACASFGMFTDYKDRGNQFKKLVNEL